MKFAVDISPAGPWGDPRTLAELAALAERSGWKVAAEAMTVDHLSGGRMILGVGSGDPASVDMTRLGEAEAARTRAAMLDEALEVIDGLWRGEPLSFEGTHYSLDDITLRPRPLQQPRIPIWIGGQLTRRRCRRRRSTQSAPTSQAGRFARGARRSGRATCRAPPRPRGATA